MANIKLSEIVGQFLDGNDLGHAEYSKAYRMAIRGRRILVMDVAGIKKETTLHVKSDLTADLPDDFSSVIEIGVPNNNGTIATLVENNNLSKFLDLDCDYESYNDFEDLMGNHNYSANYYRAGMGSVNNIGEYKIDEGTNTVILDPTFCYKNLLLRYNSNDEGFDQDGEYTINEKCSEALLAFITYEFYKHKLGVPQNHKLEYKMNWYNEKRLAIARMKNYTLQALNDSARLNTKFVIKN